MRRRNGLALLPKLPLLISESADEFDALRDAFEREIKPRSVIEQMYVHDISSIVWEILRLRRCKVVIVNSAFRSALEGLLLRFLKQPGQPDLHVRAQTLAQSWFGVRLCNDWRLDTHVDPGATLRIHSSVSGEIDKTENFLRRYVVGMSAIETGSFEITEMFDQSMIKKPSLVVKFSTLGLSANIVALESKCASTQISD